MTDPTKFPGRVHLHQEDGNPWDIPAYKTGSDIPDGHVQCEYIRADLVPTWRPIADMPDEYKDGREILLRGEGACIVAEYAKNRGRIRGYCWVCDGIWHHRDWPTHWMPLPEDPEIGR